MSHNDFGALIKDTNEYIHPNNAKKGIEYICNGCEKKVIFKHGEIRRPHFAHHVQNKCHYYDHPNESEIHKEAKLRFADIIGKMEIIIKYRCHSCDSKIEYEIVLVKNDKVKNEFYKNKNSYDIAIINNKEPKCVIEICVTHKTETFRPEPWFEIDGENFLETYSSVEDDKIVLNCIRKNHGRYCEKCFRKFIKYVHNIPELKKQFDKQEMLCIGCELDIYNPIRDGTIYRPICYPCLKTASNKFIDKWIQYVKPKYVYKRINDTFVDIVINDNHIYIKDLCVDKEYINEKNSSTDYIIWILSVEDIFKLNGSYYCYRKDLLNFDLKNCSIFLDSGYNMYELCNKDMRRFYDKKGNQYEGCFIKEYTYKKFSVDVFGYKIDYPVSKNEHIIDVTIECPKIEINQQTIENELSHRRAGIKKVSDMKEQGLVRGSNFYFYGCKNTELTDPKSLYTLPITKNENGEDVIKIRKGVIILTEYT